MRYLDPVLKCLAVLDSEQIDSCTDIVGKENKMTKYAKNLSYRRYILYHSFVQQNGIKCSTFKTLNYVPREDEEC